MRDWVLRYMTPQDVQIIWSCNILKSHALAATVAVLAASFFLPMVLFSWDIKQPLILFMCCAGSHSIKNPSTKPAWRLTSKAHLVAQYTILWYVQHLDQAGIISIAHVGTATHCLPAIGHLHQVGAHHGGRELNVVVITLFEDAATHGVTSRVCIGNEHANWSICLCNAFFFDWATLFSCFLIFLQGLKDQTGHAPVTLTTTSALGAPWGSIRKEASLPTGTRRSWFQLAERLP